MRVAWMIFYLKDREISEHKTYEADETHYFRSIETWDDELYASEELAIQALSECEFGTNELVLIHKVYVRG